MPSYAKIRILGHLGQNPEMKEVNGDQVCNFSVATNHKAKNGDKTTIWWSVGVWGKRGESCYEYLEKRSLVEVEGTFSTRVYTNRDGETKTVYEILYPDVTFMGGKSDGDQDRKPASSGSAAQGDGPPPPGDEDLPF